MRSAFAAVSEAAALLADQIPRSAIESLAEAVAACEPQAVSIHTTTASIPHGHHRALASCFVELWQEYAPDVPPVAAAMCLLGAVEGLERHRSDGTAEFVWTGPDVGIIPVRRTEQALLQLIEAAGKRVTIVSFAVYHVPKVADALTRAAARGCDIIIVLETPDSREGKAAYDTVAALGPRLRERAQLYRWPAESRLCDPRGRSGLMHVKAAVADGMRVLLSSANLTEYAFTTNMELGVMITGGRLPLDVERQFDELIASQVLVPITDS